ncbi:hypothetical protein M3697_01045 [Janibacter melonis]|uniref:hypothetical protein n=1 Tax=Janibacter melonis TaxID=262209 RepID=UPI002042D579|nr:hypothetical protein [Janibacter melonis]MCM3553705.1 hypothetical protein [Janibacter melonis]
MAGVLGERSAHLPFWVGAVAVLLGVAVLLTGRTLVRAIEDQPDHGAEPVGSEVEAAAVTAGT